MELDIKMRWPFYFMSSLALVAGVLAMVRTWAVSQTVTGVYTYGTFVASVLSILEQNVGIVTANLVPIGPLFSRTARQAVDADQHQRLPSSHSDAASMKSNTLTIKGSKRVSFDLPAVKEEDNDGRSHSHVELAEWPRGIIKTVEVQITEEEATDADRRFSTGSHGTFEQDWETMLRSAPSRGPSRLGYDL